MTTLWGILLTSFIVGLSGAMMPGPLLAVTVRESPRRGCVTGPLLIIGHGVLELTLVVLIIFGIGGLLKQDGVRGLIALVGGGVLLWMGYGAIKTARSLTLSDGDTQDKTGTRREDTRLILAGVVISFSNPYWIIWWATIGLAYISMSLKYGVSGITAFYVGHILSDFVWYSAVSSVCSAGKRIMSDEVYRGIGITCGSILLFFGIYFGYGGMKMLRGGM